MSSPIECPKCGSPLTPRTIETVSVDQCTQCQGIWFDEKELEAVLTRSHNLRRGLRTDHTNPGLNQKRGTCPRDRTAMLRAFSAADEKVVLDMCPECHGLWLDGGELHRLIQAINRR